MNKAVMLWKIAICLFGAWLIYETSSFVACQTAGCNTNGCLPIPLVKTSLPSLNTGEPIAKRCTKFKYYLQPSVRIHVNDVNDQNMIAIGSGTICYYDIETGDAYVISCGHLFGSRSMKPGSYIGIKKAIVEIFYKNNHKLDSPQKFLADVICYDNQEDISILRFTPDWIVEHYFPIAPLNYKMQPGDIYEATGCDLATEVAAYTVELLENKKIESKTNLVTRNNSPRSGRSGGGLLSKSGYYLAITWATSEEDGTGYGFYVPLSRIHAYLNQYKQVNWLLDVHKDWYVMRNIPIVDENGNIVNVPDDFVPLPTRNARDPLLTSPRP